MKRILNAFLFASVVTTGVSQTTHYVNPFIGTKEMGHTFPGAVVPFGFVQLSPDTDTIPYGKDGKYNPRSTATALAISMTIPPSSDSASHSLQRYRPFRPRRLPRDAHPRSLQLNPGTSQHPESGYRSAYRHETEKASPGYYRVYLDEPGVLAELTTTARVGVHRYTFPKTDSAHIILDMNHGIYNYPGKVLWAYVRMVNDSLAVGYRITSGWALTRYIYFAMAFSKPVKS
ncbi:MAG: hypothetical protein MZV63_41530 [Marinilabiliales bacterium]|nr:hypothetical protein [Marinilabiliales bacterium]